MSPKADNATSAPNLRRNLISGLRILLDGSRRLHVMLLVVGMVLGAAFELAGVGAVPLFVAALTTPSLLAQVAPAYAGALAARADPVWLAVVGAGALVGVFVFKNAFLAALVYFEGRLLRDIASTTACRLFRCYVYSPYTFHLQRNPAELIRNLADQVETTADLLRNLAVLVREGLVLALIFILVLYMNPAVSLAAFALIGIAAAAFYGLVRRSLRQRGLLAQGHRARQLRAVTEGLGSIKDLKVLGREAHLIETFRSETQALEESRFYPRVIAALPRLLLEVVAIVAVFVIVTLMALLGRQPQEMLPMLALLAVAAARLIPAFNAITACISNIRYDRAAFDTVVHELGILEPSGQTSESRVSSSLNRCSEIRVHDVHFSYPGSANQALCGVSIHVRRGEAIGLIGPSGSGKSTLVDVLLGLLVPQAGEVLADEEDVHHRLAAWTRQVGYVPQDVYLLDDTIRRNVAFGLPDDEVDEGALQRALKAAQLDAFVRSLPQGVHTVVGNRGVRLSGGQRQRIAIARALYHDPALLVMDEATSALDAETEREVIEAVRRLRGARAIILVAHRLTTVAGCDRLYLLREGRVVDRGTYEELSQRHESMRMPAGTQVSRAGHSTAPDDRTFTR